MVTLYAFEAKLKLIILVVFLLIIFFQKATY